jgi:Holliday junction resolvase
MIRENIIERYLVRRVRELGGMAVKQVWQGRRGAPDRLVILPGGKMFFVECKAPGQSCRPHQLREHDRLRKLGITVLVIDNKDFIDEVLGC